MPLVAPALAKEMLKATNKCTSATVAQKKLGDAISKYIMQNAIVTFAWVAVKPVPPPPVPDPVVIATGKISGIKIMLKPDKSSKPGKGLITMGMQIQMGCAKGMYKPNAPWATSPGMLSSIPPLKLSLSRLPSREATMLKLATQIVVWMTSYVPSIPCSGVRGPYIGVATPTKIS